MSEENSAQDIFYPETSSDVINPGDLQDIAEHPTRADIQSNTTDKSGEVDVQRRRYFKSYSIIPGTSKSHDTAILEMTLEHMTNNQVGLLCCLRCASYASFTFVRSV